MKDYNAADALMKIFGLTRADPDLAVYIAVKVAPEAIVSATKAKGKDICQFCYGRKCKGECK